jgi:hypothetical protein
MDFSSISPVSRSRPGRTMARRSLCSTSKLFRSYPTNYHGNCHWRTAAMW